jgi:hypothetical protein
MKTIPTNYGSITADVVKYGLVADMTDMFLNKFEHDLYVKLLDRVSWKLDRLTHRGMFRNVVLE